MSDSILIVDDERGIRETLRAVLEDEGFETDAVASGEECLKAVERRAFGCVLLDVWLPGIDGLETLSLMRERGADASVVMISGHGNIETAVRSTKLGAFDFIEKPLSIGKTVLTVRNALRQRELERVNAALSAELSDEWVMVGESVAMRALRKQIELVAPTDGRVLVYGESGTGKELVARAIHARSLRAAAPFVELNCSAVPEELIESELFGHVRGAFTGATGARRCVATPGPATCASFATRSSASSSCTQDRRSRPKTSPRSAARSLRPRPRASPHSATRARRTSATSYAPSSQRPKGTSRAQRN